LPQTKSAAATSFLNWGEPVWTKSKGELPVQAKRGDVAVFRHRSNPAHGHVAFFIGMSEKYDRRIDVLGGNQILRAGKQKIHLIDRRPMAITGDLELYEVRTMDGVRTVG
jgi:hypothetical protein